MISRYGKWHALYAPFALLISMLLVLSGCSPTKGTNISDPTITSIPEASFSTANLLEVVSSKGVACNSPVPGLFFSEKSLVLATDRLIYDQAEVNQITAFVNSQGADLVGNRDTPLIPPDTLKYITGSPPGSVLYPGDSEDSTLGSTFCSVFLTVTNISQKTLQIPQMHLRYLDNTEPNAQLYRLINVCSIGRRLQEGNRCPEMGAGPGVGYEVRFAVSRGPANTVLSGILGPNNPTLPSGAIPILRPGDAAEITIGMNITDYTSGLAVSIVPEIVVTSSSGTQTFTLTQLKMDIAIAAPQNVSCYALKGTTFVEQNPQIQHGSWCV
jgi:hypothetical protein